MKQINGTITLSFLEEDNLQRVIFRVVPLCTKEGTAFRDKEVNFPDAGSLRIVPDKREQSTFKERMRSMGCLCAIQLHNDGKELSKVRQNRNYDPAQGEVNQFAIYSDVICEFAENGVLEVFEDGKATSAAVTENVLIRRDMVLYGPQPKNETAEPAALHPFGNDSYLLSTVLMPDGSERVFYWNPELLVNWRQRRGTLRRGKPRDEMLAAEDKPFAPPQGEEQAERRFAAKPEAPTAQAARIADKPVVPQAARIADKPVAPQAARIADKPVAPQAARIADKPVAPQPAPRAEKRVSAQAASEAPKPLSEAKPEASVKTSDAAKPADAPKSVETSKAVETPKASPNAAPVKAAEAAPAAEKPAAAPKPEKDGALPIGAKLNILDSNITFEEQISQLAQPLSGSANRLDGGVSAPVEEEPVTPLHFSGTPLVKAAQKAVATLNHPSPLHYVVERHLREEDAPGQHSDFTRLENPIENLRVAIEAAWQSAETREHALQMLAEDEGFLQPLLKQLSRRGQELHVLHAAREQMEDIEAERLSLLMQLDQCKADTKQAQDSVLANLSRKRRDEIDRLTAKVEALKAEQSKLQATLQTMSGEISQKTLSAHASMMNGQSDGHIVLSPVIGETREFSELVDAVRAAMNWQGFGCSEDEVTELLLHFALDDSFCLVADSEEDAAMYAMTMLDALGLKSQTVRTRKDTVLEIVNLLPNNGLRTPTVELAPMDREISPVCGHRVIRLMPRTTPITADMPLPIVHMPALRERLKRGSVNVPEIPTSLESLDSLRNNVKPLMPDGETWFSRIETRAEESNVQIPKTTFREMRIFVSVASRKLRGGFLAAADAAMLGWGVPMLRAKGVNVETLRQDVGSLPRTMEALGIE